MKWECSSECKNLSDSDVCTIIDLDIIFAGGAWIFKNEHIIYWGYIMHTKKVNECAVPSERSVF